MAASTIPTSPEQITAAWLTQALAERFPGCDAADVVVIDAHSGTTGRARLRVDWKNSAGAPSALFSKLAPTDPISREMVITTGMGKREARFYAELAADVPVRVAAPVWTGWNETGDAYLMLMEDLADTGCDFPQWTDEAVSDYARAMMDGLACLHGHFRNSSRFSGDLAWIEPPMRSDWGPLMVKSAVEQFADDMPSAFREMAEIYTEHTEALNERLDAGAHTLIHGDSHLGNLFIDGQRIGFLDWACVCRAPGLRDVSYFLCNSLSTELRRSDERALIGRYLTGFDAPLPFEEAWLQYRLFAVCAWIAASVTAAAGSRMQPIEIGMRSMHRATGALIDLDTPELIREELGLR